MRNPQIVSVIALLIMLVCIVCIGGLPVADPTGSIAAWNGDSQTSSTR